MKSRLFTLGTAASGKEDRHRLYPRPYFKGVSRGPELDPAKLAGQARPSDAGLSGQGGAGPRPGAAQDPSAAGVRRRGAQPDGGAGPGGGRQGFPAAGRRLRRKLRRIPSRQYPRHLPRAAADGGGADLCRRRAGGESGPHRRPVRQAALRRFRDPETASRCRPIAATISMAASSRRKRAFPIRSA